MIKELIKYTIELKKKYSSLNSIIKDNNIKVMLDDNLNQIQAYTIKIRNDNIVMINSYLDELEYNFVLAHEIYHILNHDDNTRCFSKIINIDRYELEANVFAVIFLDINYQNNNTIISKIINNTLSTIKGAIYE